MRMWYEARRLALAATVIAAVCCGTAAAGSPPGKSNIAAEPLVVHEWGTFLSMQGSDGVTLGGMVDSDEVLPEFIRWRALQGLSRASLYTKMETPVTYFYVDRPTTVRVHVEMRHGMLTHWYPAVNLFGPELRPQNAKPKSEEDSFLHWNDVHLVPQKQLKGAKATGLPAVDNDSIWRFARETDSALVGVQRGSKTRPIFQYEKFLFYRGLGKFDLPMQVQASGAGDDLRLVLHNRGRDEVPASVIVNVERNQVRFLSLPALAGGATREVQWSALSAAGGVATVKDAVAAELVKTGLYAKEARAMVNTWERSYFRTDGLRVVYLLPRRIVDQVIPLHIEPAPTSTVRVMVGRVEVLTPQREKAIEKAVAALGSSLASERSVATALLAQLGRFEEPALHRVASMTLRPEIKARSEALLHQVAKQK